MWTAVYASNNIQAQGELWEELSTLRGINVPWIIGGDFNAYTSVHEKKSGVVELGPKCKAFKAFVENIGLCDLGYMGLPFTWCNNQAGANRIWVHLNRMLANSHWVGDHPHCTVFHLDSSASDHAPLLLMVQITPEKVARPFRFEMYWLEYESCGRVVERIWRQVGRTNPMHDFMHKVQEPEGVGRLFLDFYKNLWGSEAYATPPRDEWPKLPKLSLEDAQQLDVPVSCEEIKAALWSLPRGKAPGQDGLQVEVYT
ncbi:uncharacterized protein [Typha latifolia]|uniref:uncharacterized protein n=1 Tax=Typha latifolia TaxID=4733 RepID=UPI003C2E2E55